MWLLFVPRPPYLTFPHTRMKVKMLRLHDFLVASHEIPVLMHNSCLNQMPSEPFWQTFQKPVQLLLVFSLFRSNDLFNPNDVI